MSNEAFFGDGADGGMRGVAVGLVTDNEDPQGIGRVKVAFPWRADDGSSSWARIATPMAHDDAGTYFLPELGDEVLVGFENGDIHHPYVLGALWSGTASPPESNDGLNSVKEIKSTSGHEIELDDSPGGEKVTIETQGGHKITLDDSGGSEKITVEGKDGNNTITLDASNDEVSIDAKKDLNLSAKNISIDADEEVSISSKKVTAESKQKMELSSNGQMKLSSTAMMEAKASSILKLQGAMIKIN